MKKVLTAAILSFLLTGSTVYADEQAMSANKQCDHKGGQHGMKGKMRAMHHANPMPNLMMIAKKNAAELNLTADQEKVLARWREKNHSVNKAQVEKVIKLENEIMMASLSGEDKASLMAKVDEMLAVRREIASRKVLCRDNLKRILSDEQYQRLITAYTEHRAARHQRMKQHMM